MFAGDVGGEDVGVARRGLEGRYRIVVEHHQHVFQVGAFALQGTQFQQDGRASLAVAGHTHSVGCTVQVAFPQGAGESHRTRVPEDEGVERETVAAVQVDIPADAFLVEGDVGVVILVGAYHFEGVVMEIEQDDGPKGEAEAQEFADDLPCSVFLFGCVVLVHRVKTVGR